MSIVKMPNNRPIKKRLFAWVDTSIHTEVKIRAARAEKTVDEFLNDFLKENLGRSTRG
jgi:predicted HicB family RNase H-like nuclease